MSSSPWNTDPPFLWALPIVLDREGGASRDASDRAVADVPPGQIHTYRGVRASTWRSWLRHRGLDDSRPVQEATEGEVRELYWSWYWRAGGSDRLDPPLSLVLFDGAVNHGTGTAVRVLQGMVGTRADGAFGPITQEAAHSRDPDRAADRYLWLRLRLYSQIVAGDRSQLANLRGWLNRMIHLRLYHVWEGKRDPPARTPQWKAEVPPVRLEPIRFPLGPVSGIQRRITQRAG